jgi:predicted O-methyltransferase YrrM
MQGPATWAQVDEYICDHLCRADPTLEGALASSQASGLPPLSVSSAQGKFLHIVAAAIGARRILEVGTLGRYSTIWLARALPADGRVVSLESEETHARVARANLDKAGVGDRAQVRIGPALELLPRLQHEIDQPFCLSFIDADKANIPHYFDWAVKLSRPGSLIVVDNVVREGSLIDPQSMDENVIGVRRLHELLAKDRRVTATTLQTVGVKGYDGLTIAVVK